MEDCAGILWGDFGLKQFREFIKTESGPIKWVGTLLKRCDFGMKYFELELKGEIWIQYEIKALQFHGLGKFECCYGNRLLIKYVTNKLRHWIIWKCNESYSKEVKTKFTCKCNSSARNIFTFKCNNTMHVNLKIFKVIFIYRIMKLY